jgi:peroxiredoxin
MAIINGARAPDFRFQNQQSGKETSLLEFSKGRPVYLALFRFASCPFCNLRIHRLINRYNEIQDSGLKILAVLESSEEIYNKNAGRQNPPFAVTLDPEHRIYELYHAERSNFGLLRTFFSRPGDLAEAMARGYGHGEADGPRDRMPADFLLGHDLTVYRAHYGHHASDHLPVADMIDFGRRYEAIAARFIA